MVQNSHAGEEGTHWGETNKANYHFTWGTFHIHPKLSKIWKLRQWYRNFPEKIPEILESVEFPKWEPFNRKFWKFWEQSWMERKLPGKHFRKFGYTSRGFPLFWKFWKMLFLSLLEVAKNSNQTFWLNGKHPTMYMYPWLFCTMTNCKGPISSYQCNLTLWIV